MAISRSDMNRQLYDEGGIITLDQAKEMAPPGESLAYINPEEAALLKSLGGAGEDVNGTGIKSYFFKISLIFVYVFFITSPIYVHHVLFNHSLVIQ